MADQPSTRTVLKAVTERWYVCCDCGGDGRLRPVLTEGFDPTPSSTMTAIYTVTYGDPTDAPCNRCGGLGGYWVEDYDG